MANERQRPVIPSIRANIGACAVVLFGSAGCAGVFGFDGTSASDGWHGRGAIRNPAVLPVAGDGYVIPSPWRERLSNFGTEELVGSVVRASRTVARRYPGALAAVGDISRRGGGASAEHRSHQNGRDVDIFFYGTDKTGRPDPPGNTMYHFDRAGRASRWSPPKGARAPASAVPDVQFDVRRNWAFVRALLQDPDSEVQWVFIQRDLASRMIEHGTSQGDDAALLARAAQIIRQPSDSEPHDDHMHVRIYCDVRDRSLGCADRGPERWWKKRWKFMTPPFGRSSQPDASAALADLLRQRSPLAFEWAQATP